MKNSRATFQIGKNGLTDGIINTIKIAFSKRENVKVSVLKSAGHEKKKVREFADNIVKELGRRYTYKIVGFTIFLKKFRKPVR